MGYRNVKVNGEDKKALLVPFSILEEHWNRYSLRDGTILRAKHSAIEIMRIDSMRTPSGEPTYLIGWQACIVAEEVPEILMSSTKESEEPGKDDLDSLL